MKRSAGRPSMPKNQRAETVTIRMPMDAKRKIQAMAMKAGFVTKSGKPKIAAFLMYIAGV